MVPGPKKILIYYKILSPFSRPNVIESTQFTSNHNHYRLRICVIVMVVIGF